MPTKSWRESQFVLPPKKSGLDLTDGQIGCALSHAFAFFLMLSRGYDNVMICEDDVVFDNNCLEMISNYMHQIPDDWDITHFHSNRSDDHPFNLDRKKLSDNNYIGYKEAAGSVCYAITRRCAHYLLSVRFPINTPADGITNWPTSPWTSGYKGYVTMPYICELSTGFPSEIGKRSRPFNAN